MDYKERSDMEENDFVAQENLSDKCTCEHRRDQHTVNQHCNSRNCECLKFQQKYDGVEE
jgi:hypothetical protein